MKKIFILLIVWLFIWHFGTELVSLNQSVPLAKNQDDFSTVKSNDFGSLATKVLHLSQFATEVSDYSFLEQGATNSSNFSQANDDFSKLATDKLNNTSAILPADEAFSYSAYMESSTILVARWQIADNYYLYRDKLQFALNNGGILGQIQFPAGKLEEDVKYGRVEIYENQLEIKIPVFAIQNLESLTLATTYQGCAKDRMCYPPVQKTTTIDLSNTPAKLNDVTNSPATPTTTQAISAANDWDNVSKNPTKFLTVKEAFVVSAEFSDPSHLQIRWQIADGYYLYQNKLKFSSPNDDILGTPQLPPSTSKTDPYFGEVEIYTHPQLEVVIPLKTTGLQTVSLEIKYQGCALAGLCYPPITQVIDVTFGATAISEQDKLANLLTNANVLYVMLMFFGLGLLLAFTPCVFPMVPILSGIIVGQGKQVTTYQAFIMSVIYVLAMAFTYAVVGALTGLLGENLQAIFQNPWVLISFALMFVALSFSMFGFYDLQIPNSLQTKLSALSNRQQGGTLIGVAIMGVLSALIVGPCVAAPLVGALIYIGHTGDWVLGFFSLFSMSLGMGVPLIIVGTSAGHILPKTGKWMDTIKAFFGVMLLAVAIWMLARILPGQATMFLWASLLIIVAVYIGALDRLSAGVSGWHKLNKGLGLIVFIYGILLMIGGACGNVNPLQPLQNLNNSLVMSTDNFESEFKTIKGVGSLKRELVAATDRGKPVILEFYADWCVSCKEMKHFTFADAGVRKLLANFVLLQADVTANDELDKALSKHFEIFGPPVVLFFDVNGQEQYQHRVVGFMPADAFRQHLTKVIKQ